MKKSRTHLKILTILLPIAILILFLMQNYILAFIPFLPTCFVYSTFDLYCPACGNTRSVMALFDGDLLTSLRYNIIPLLLLLLLFLAYLELAFYSFGKDIRILPRKLSFYLTLIALIVVYLILRNFIPYLTP